jgi:formylmethanofuran dehydrogenase subunit D
MVTLISGRTFQQGVGLEEGKTSERYFESVSYIELSKPDASALDLEEGHPLEVTTPYGSVIVYGHISDRLTEGIAFFPYGPWANQVMGSETEGTGMPKYKGIRAKVSKSIDRDVPSLVELLDMLREGDS